MYQSAGFLLSSLCLSVSLLGGPVWGVTTADNPGIRTVFTTKGLDYCKAIDDSIVTPLPVATVATWSYMTLFWP